MARYTEAVCRICRREGAKLFLKGSRCYTKKCAFERRPSPPGQHGVRRRKVGEYGLQLREKQKVRKTYGVLERQFRNYFIAAEGRPGVTGENLLRSLELRLDNVVYRMGLGTSRAQARQLVAHGHFAVNGVPTDIASYQLRPGDTGRRAREPARSRAVQDRQGDPPQPPGAGVAVHRRGHPGRFHRLPAQPRPDAARSQRAARGRVLLEVTAPHDRTREPADRACRGSRHVRQVRGRTPPGRLRRHPRQRASARPPVLARGRRGHQHPDPRRVPGVLDDPRRQGRRHPDRPQRQEAPPQELRGAPRPDAAHQERRGRGHRGRHRGERGRRDHQPRSRADDPRHGRRDDRDGPHRRARRRLSRCRARRGAADRGHRGRRDLHARSARSTTGSRTCGSVR